MQQVSQEFSVPLPDPELDAEFYETVPLKRLIAFFIDAVIISAVAIVSVLVFGIVTLGIGFAMAFPIALLIAFGYRWITLASNSATFGMRFMGIEIRGASGAPLTSSEAAFHSGIFIALTFTVIGWIATVITIMATARHQGLPDLLLGTAAVNRPVD